MPRRKARKAASRSIAKQFLEEVFSETARLPALGVLGNP
jgi:hypothetical protein